MFKKWSILLLLLIPLILIACGDDKQDDKPSNAKTNSDLKLPQTFIDQESGLTVQYPAGWVAVTEGSGVAVASSQAALESETLSADDLGVIIEVNPIASLGAADLDGVFTAFTSAMTAANDGTTVTPPTSLKIGTTDARRITITHPEEGDAVLIAWLTDGGTSVLSVMGVAPQGKLSTLEPYVLAIANNLKYTAP